MPFALALALLGALSVAPLLVRPENHDTALFLTIAARWLESGRLYGDLVEINPPLILWLSAQAVAIGRALDVRPAMVWLVETALLAGASLTVIGLLARRLAPADSGGARLVTLACAVGFFLLPGVHFGQREHLALMLVMPYVLLGVLRSRHVPVEPHLALAVGAASGVGFCLKPLFGLLWLAAELWLGVKSRSPRSVTRRESAVVVAVATLYVLAVLVLAPDYLTLVREYGGRYATLWRQPAGPIILALLPAVLALLLWGVAVRTAGGDGLAAAVASQVAVWIVIVLIQRKNFAYHRLPAYATALVLAASLAPAAIGWSRRRLAWLSTTRVAHAALALALGVALVTFPGELREARGQRVRMQLLAGQLRQLVPDGKLAVLNGNMLPWFPLGDWAGLRWTTPFPALWFLHGKVPGDTVAGLELTAHRLMQAAPATLIVENVPYTHVLSYFDAVPGFAAFRAAYHPIGTLTVFRPDDHVVLSRSGLPAPGAGREPAASQNRSGLAATQARASGPSGVAPVSTPGTAAG